CRSAIARVSSNTIDSSAPGLTPILVSTNRATLISSISEMSKPDSLDTSMLTVVAPPQPSPAGAGGPADARRPPGSPVHGRAGLLVLGFVSRIGVHDFRDQPVPHDVGAGQFRNVDIVDTTEDVGRGAQTRPGATGQVDLSDVTGDHHLGAETQP